MQPLDPVLLNSSSKASTIDHQALVSCWGVRDTGAVVLGTVKIFPVSLLLWNLHNGLDYFDSHTNFAGSDDIFRTE